MHGRKNQGWLYFIPVFRKEETDRKNCASLYDTVFRKLYHFFLFRVRPDLYKFLESAYNSREKGNHREKKGMIESRQTKSSGLAERLKMRRGSLPSA